MTDLNGNEQGSWDDLNEPDVWVWLALIAVLAMVL